MIAELARLQENTQLRSTYNDTWHQWLPKLIKAIKINMTMATTKRMKEIDVNKDLEDEDGKMIIMYYKTNPVLIFYSWKIDIKSAVCPGLCIKRPQMYSRNRQTYDDHSSKLYVLLSH